MCAWNVRLLHRVTQSVSTVSDSFTTVPIRSMLESERREHCRWHVPDSIVSDLSLFMAKPLK